MSEKKKFWFRGDNNWMIWAKKWIWAVVVPSAGALAIATAEYINVNPFPVDPSQAWISSFIAMILMQIGNLIKHK
jgi:hypothetical protein